MVPQMTECGHIRKLRHSCICRVVLLTTDSFLFRYNSCDVGTLPNQTWPNGTWPTAAKTSGSHDYGGELSYVRFNTFVASELSIAYTSILFSYLVNERLLVHVQEKIIQDLMSVLEEEHPKVSLFSLRQLILHFD